MKLNKILKYLVYSIITVLLLQYIPQKKLPFYQDFYYMRNEKDGLYKLQKNMSI